MKIFLSVYLINPMLHYFIKYLPKVSYFKLDSEYLLSFGGKEYAFEIVSNFEGVSRGHDDIIIAKWSIPNDYKFQAKKNIFAKIDEIYHPSDTNMSIDEEMKLILENNKIFSSCINYEIQHKNLLTDEFLNFLFFYNENGYTHLSFKEQNIKKTNLIGGYFRYEKDSEGLLIHGKESKNDRQEVHTQIKRLSKNRLVEFKTDKDIPNTNRIAKTINKINHGHWNKNHIAGYSDYITTVVGLEHDSMGSKTDLIENRQWYFNEKSLKAILYSKLNIPFIFDTTEYSLDKLKELGFWFLNMEFTDDTSDYYLGKYNRVNDGIIKTIEFLNKLYEESYDLDKVHKTLVDMYGYKMKKNYDLFHHYLEYPPNSDKIIEFILNWEE